MDTWAAAVGLPAGQFNVLFVLVIAYPFAILFSKIPVKYHTARHLFSILVSMTLYCLLFTVIGYLSLLGSALVVYLLTHQLRHRPIGPLVVFAWTMGHVSLDHYYTQILGHSNGHFDQSAPLMVLAIKLTSFAWCAYDGTKKEQELTEFQKKVKIKTMPNLIEYLGYIFFFGGFLVGPAFEFSDYLRFIRGHPPFDKIPSRVIPTLKCLLSAILCGFLFIQFRQSYDLHLCVEPEFDLLSPFQKFIYILIACGVARNKFYVAWKISEGACILAGVGYNGVDPKNPKQHLFNRVENIRILNFELPENPKAVSDSWNINTSLWLRNYVYVRLQKSIGNGWAQMATNMTSAFWHGFHPGYYMFFGTASFFIMVARSARRHIRPLFVDTKLEHLKAVYDVGGIMMTAMSVGYMMVPFVLKEFNASMRVWASLGFGMHLFQFVVYCLLEWGGVGSFLRRTARRLTIKQSDEKEDILKKKD